MIYPYRLEPDDNLRNLYHPAIVHVNWGNVIKFKESETNRQMRKQVPCAGKYSPINDWKCFYDVIIYYVTFIGLLSLRLLSLF